MLINVKQLHFGVPVLRIHFSYSLINKNYIEEGVILHITFLTTL